VWVGNTDNKPMKEVLGSMGAGRIWHDFMEDVHLGTPEEHFVPPPGIREYKVCLETGQAPTPDCNNVLTEVWPETYTPAQFAIVPGLPSPDMMLRGDSVKAGKILGQTVSAAGQNLQPIPTPMPGEKRPTPAPGPVGPVISATATPVPIGGAPQPTPGAVEQGAAPTAAPVQPAPSPPPPTAQPAAVSAPAGPPPTPGGE
jgi:membrane peptidoglycan carboxypeptidase